MKHFSPVKFILLLSSSLFYSQIGYATNVADDLYKVKNEAKDYVITLDASIEALNQATLSAQTTGRVIKINFDTNDYVTEGDVLLEITSKEQGAKLAASEADLRRAKAAYNEARLDYNRYKKLYPKGAISKGELDRSEANARTSKQQIKAAEANLVQAKESLKYTIIKAPFSGIVTKRHIEMGETISPGQALFSGMSLDKLRAVSEVPQRYIETLRKNPEFTITLNDGSTLFSDDITLFNYAENQSHSFKIRINLPATKVTLLPGMWVKAKFVNGSRTTILIPSSAVLVHNELTAVYRDFDGRSVLTQVRLGKTSEGYVEVLSGLFDGDMISTDAYKKLQQLEAK